MLEKMHQQEVTVNEMYDIMDDQILAVSHSCNCYKLDLSSTAAHVLKLMILFLFSSATHRFESMKKKAKSEKKKA